MYLPESMEYGEDFLLEISTDGGYSFSTVKSWAAGIDFDNGYFYSETVSIVGNFSDHTVLRFRCDASSNYDKIYLDNIKITLCGCNGGSEPACDGEISHYELIDTNGEVMTAISEGDTLCGTSFDHDWTRIRVTAAGDHESMFITVNGPYETVTKLENYVTYDSDYFWAEYEGLR